MPIFTQRSTCTFQRQRTHNCVPHISFHITPSPSLPLFSVSNTQQRPQLCVCVCGRLSPASQQPEAPWMGIWWGTQWKESSPAVVGELRSLCCSFFHPSLFLFLPPHYPTPTFTNPSVLSSCFFANLLSSTTISAKQSRQFVVMATGFIFCRSVWKTAREKNKLSSATSCSVCARVHSFVGGYRLCHHHAERKPRQAVLHHEAIRHVQTGDEMWQFP